MKIEIHWTHDEHDCETCGSSYAEGATVKIDGEEVLNFEPLAACFDGATYDKDIVYEAIFKRLGCEVVETHQEYEPRDYGYDDDE